MLAVVLAVVPAAAIPAPIFRQCGGDGYKAELECPSQYNVKLLTLVSPPLGYPFLTGLVPHLFAVRHSSVIMALIS